MTQLEADGSQPAAALVELDGLSALRAVMTGELPPPPMAALMGMELLEVDAGRALFAATPGPQHYNPLGTVHGGLAATLIDSATGCAVHTTLPAGTAYTSIEIKVSYLRAITVDTGPVTVTGRVTKPGRRVAFADGEARDGEGRLLATAQSSLLVMAPR